MNKQELEKENKSLKDEMKRLIETNQQLQKRENDLSQELYNTQIMELQKRRELDTATQLIARLRAEQASEAPPNLPEAE